MQGHRYCNLNYGYNVQGHLSSINVSLLRLGRFDLPLHGTNNYNTILCNLLTYISHFELRPNVCVLFAGVQCRRTLRPNVCVLFAGVQYRRTLRPNVCVMFAGVQCRRTLRPNVCVLFAGVQCRRTSCTARRLPTPP